MFRIPRHSSRLFLMIAAVLLLCMGVTGESARSEEKDVYWFCDIDAEAIEGGEKVAFFSQIFKAPWDEPDADDYKQKFRAYLEYDQPDTWYLYSSGGDFCTWEDDLESARFKFADWVRSDKRAGRRVIRTGWSP